MSEWDDLKRRVTALEQRKLGLTDVPLSPLKHYLEQNWQPDGNQLALPGSIGASALANIPAVRVYETGQVVATGLGAPGTTIDFTTERFDKANMWNSAFPSRLTAPVAGIYYCHAFGELQTANTAEWSVRLLHSDGTVVSEVRYGPFAAVPNFDTGMAQSGLFYFAAGDYLTVDTEHNCGGNRQVHMEAGMAWLGPYR